MLFLLVLLDFLLFLQYFLRHTIDITIKDVFLKLPATKSHHEIIGSHHYFMEIFNAKKTMIETRYDNINFYFWEIAKLDLIQIV